jgi:hypothetical protein
VTPQSERAMSGIHIGIDLDNTLINYDDVFGPIAENIGLFEKGNAPGSKEAVKAQLIARDPSERLWMRLQGQVYGRHIGMAKPCEGATEFLAAAQARGARVSIVSHKTRYGHFDIERVNLWDAARGWLSEQGFFGPNGFGIAEDDVYFEETRDAKIERIASIGCHIFVDDLEEVLTHPDFPASVQRIWYATKELPDEKKGHLERYRGWREIMDKVGKTL